MNAILLNLPVPITTPRLLLKPPQIGDGAIVNAAVLESLNELCPYMPWANTAPSVSDTEEFCRLAAANWILKKNEEPYLPLFIFNRQTGDFIGGTGFHHLDWKIPCIETGYWIRSTCAKLGFMTEAVNALTQYAFQELNVKRIAITCAKDNIRSQKLAERLGYTLEGTLRYNRLTINNELSSTLIFARYDVSNLPELPVKW